MGMSAFLGIPGVTGSARQKHVLGKIVVNGVLGDVQNKTRPLVITKPIDVSSPPLHTALHKGTSWNVVTLEFWRMPPGGGREENYFTMVMNGVQIAGIKTLMPNNRRQENTLMPEQEEVSLCYETIGYAFRSGGKEGGTESESTSKSAVLTVEFDPPMEAKLKKVAEDLGKDAGKFIAGEAYKLFVGGGEEHK